jgi:hypothetical protein
MSSPELPYYEIRRSGIQGSGAFALRHIPKGTRLIEYTGERISHEEADRRPDFKDDTGATHVVLFTVDKHTVIDARVGGNEAQLFNHSCDGNCEAVIENKRVYLETTRDVEPGEELTYDYEMEYSGEDLADARRLYPCRCGKANCRGTLLDLPRKVLNQIRREEAAAAKASATPKRKRKKAAAAPKGTRRAKSVARSQGKSTPKRSPGKASAARSGTAGSRRKTGTKRQPARRTPPATRKKSARR